MKKVLLLLAAAAAVFAGCKKHNPEKPAPSNTTPTNVTVKAANCIIVDDDKEYHIDATVFGNGVLPQGIPEEIKKDLVPDREAAKDTLIWESEKGWITSLSYDATKKTLDFKTKGTPGNALIGVKTDYNLILWTWHIWNPGEGVDPAFVNLGATTTDYDKPEVMGFLYQWGRKEPFPAGAQREYTSSDVAPFAKLPLYGSDGNEVEWDHTTMNIIHNSIPECVHSPISYKTYGPLETLNDPAKGTGDYLAGETGYDDLWGAVSGKKTMLDPCPAGYRIGRMSDFNPKELYNMFDHDHYDDGGTLIAKGDHLWKYSGWEFSASGQTTMYFPAAGHYNGRDFSYVTVEKLRKDEHYEDMFGYYWLADAVDRKSRAIVFNISHLVMDENFEINWEDFSPKNALTVPSPRADGYSVRCMKE